MSRIVEAITGVRGLTLPNGWVLDGGDQVTISDDVWAQIEADVETLGRLTDLGSTTNVPDPVPTWRDVQRAVSSTPTGLEAEVNALNTELGNHEAATTNVHGIVDTSLLETQSGAQSKADAALASANSYTDTKVATVTSYNALFGFATASTVWTINHGQGTKYLSVEAFDDSGNRMIGEVEYPDNNTITISWYYPTSGSARVFS